MKAYIIVVALLICSYTHGQDTALFNQIDSIVAKVDLAASKSMFDTLKGIFVHPGGTANEVFVLKQGREVQKITNGHNKIIFYNGKAVFRQVQGPSATWKYYLIGEKEYLYFKEDNNLITFDDRFNYDLIQDYLRLFKDQINIKGN